MEDGSIRIEEATEETLGTYTCVPYNALGTMGQSPPARLVLKVPPRLMSSFGKLKSLVHLTLLRVCVCTKGSQIAGCGHFAVAMLFPVRSGRVFVCGPLPGCPSD